MRFDVVDIRYFSVTKNKALLALLVFLRGTSLVSSGRICTQGYSLFELIGFPLTLLTG